MRSKIIKNSY
jgi:hypothetical protein